MGDVLTARLGQFIYFRTKPSRLTQAYLILSLQRQHLNELLSSSTVKSGRQKGSTLLMFITRLSFQFFQPANPMLISEIKQFSSDVPLFLHVIENGKMPLLNQITQHLGTNPKNPASRPGTHQIIFADDPLHFLIDVFKFFSHQLPQKLFQLRRSDRMQYNIVVLHGSYFFE